MKRTQIKNALHSYTEILNQKIEKKKKKPKNPCKPFLEQGWEKERERDKERKRGATWRKEGTSYASWLHSICHKEGEPVLHPDSLSYPWRPGREGKREDQGSACCPCKTWRPSLRHSQQDPRTVTRKTPTIMKLPLEDDTFCTKETTDKSSRKITCSKGSSTPSLKLVRKRDRKWRWENFKPHLKSRGLAGLQPGKDKVVRGVSYGCLSHVASAQAQKPLLFSSQGGVNALKV